MMTLRDRLPLLRALPRPRSVPAPKPKCDRIARQLALAYLLEAAPTAKLPGLSRARISQVSDLALLSPAIQERILAGEKVGARRVREACRAVEWGEQENVLGVHLGRPHERRDSQVSKR